MYRDTYLDRIRPGGFTARWKTAVEQQLGEPQQFKIATHVQVCTILGGKLKQKLLHNWDHQRHVAYR